MRTYIFTAKERKAIKGFLEGSTPRSNPTLMTVIYRIKAFRDLAKDVEFYNRLAEAKPVTTKAA